MSEHEKEKQRLIADTNKILSRVLLYGTLQEYSGKS